MFNTFLCKMSACVCRGADRGACEMFWARMFYSSVAVTLLISAIWVWHQQESFSHPKGEMDGLIQPLKSSKSTRLKRYTINPMGYKWDHLNLTYKIVQFPSTLNRGDTEKALAIAFRMWSNVSSLTFRRVQPDQGSDLSIGFYSYNHSDCWRSPLHPCFDGLNGELAHAFLPPRGEIHFDNHEFWVLGPSRFSWKQGVWYNDLVQVAAHEIGHALGLWHSTDVTALMHPNATYTRTRHVTKDDIWAIQKLYGCGLGSSCKPTKVLGSCGSQNRCHLNCDGCTEFPSRSPTSRKIKVKTLYVPRGQSVTFNCSQNVSLPRKRVSWYKNGGRVFSSAPGIITLLPSFLVLRAENVTQGRYTCVIRQGRITVDGRSWNLYVDHVDLRSKTALH